MYLEKPRLNEGAKQRLSIKMDILARCASETSGLSKDQKLHMAAAYKLFATKVFSLEQIKTI